jgi:predicted esterase
VPEPGGTPEKGSAGRGGSVERHIRVPRTARYHIVGDPRSSTEVWFVLHGYGQLAGRFIRRFLGLPGIEDGIRAVVAPEALSRFYVDPGARGAHGPESRVGATWMTRADREHEIRDYVEYLDRVAAEVLGSDGGDPVPATLPGDRRVVVLGFSQGAATASRWVALGKIRPAELILWGGGLAVDLDDGSLIDGLTGVRIRLVAGARDGWGRQKTDEAVGRLGALGLDVDRIRYDGGHGIVPGVLDVHWPP